MKQRRVQEEEQRRAATVSPLNFALMIDNKYGTSAESKSADRSPMREIIFLLTVADGNTNTSTDEILYSNHISTSNNLTVCDSCL